VPHISTRSVVETSRRTACSPRLCSPVLQAVKQAASPRPCFGSGPARLGPAPANEDAAHRLDAQGTTNAPSGAQRQLQPPFSAHSVHRTPRSPVQPPWPSATGSSKLRREWRSSLRPNALRVPCHSVHTQLLGPQGADRACWHEQHIHHMARRSAGRRNTPRGFLLHGRVHRPGFQGKRSSCHRAGPASPMGEQHLSPHGPS